MVNCSHFLFIDDDFSLFSLRFVYFFATSFRMNGLHLFQSTKCLSNDQWWSFALKLRCILSNICSISKAHNTPTFKMNHQTKLTLASLLHIFSVAFSLSLSVCVCVHFNTSFQSHIVISMLSISIHSVYLSKVNAWHLNMLSLTIQYQISK